MGLREIGIDGANCIRLAQDGSPVAGFCEHGDEPPGYIKNQDFFDKLSYNQLFKWPAPWNK
jgi:hypothetical protein